MRLSQPALPGVNKEGILEYGLLNRHGGKGRSANGRSLLQEADINPSAMHFGSSSNSGSAPVFAATDGDAPDGDIVLDTPFPLASSTQPSPSSRCKRDSPVRGVVTQDWQKKIPWELEAMNSQPTQMDSSVPHSPIRPTAGVSGQGGARYTASASSGFAAAGQQQYLMQAGDATTQDGPALQTLAATWPVRRHRSHHVHPLECPSLLKYRPQSIRRAEFLE